MSVLRRKEASSAKDMMEGESLKLHNVLAAHAATPSGAAALPRPYACADESKYTSSSRYDFQDNMPEPSFAEGRSDPSTKKCGRRASIGVASGVNMSNNSSYNGNGSAANQYPDTFLNFADGIKSDLLEIAETSAKTVQRFIWFNPFAGSKPPDTAPTPSASTNNINEELGPNALGMDSTPFAPGYSSSSSSSSSSMHGLKPAVSSSTSSSFDSRKRRSSMTSADTVLRTDVRGSSAAAAMEEPGQRKKSARMTLTSSVAAIPALLSSLGKSASASATSANEVGVVGNKSAKTGSVTQGAQGQVSGGGSSKENEVNGGKATAPSQSARTSSRSGKSSTTTATASAAAAVMKVGELINMSKLAATTHLHTFETAEEGQVLIVGNKRMILVVPQNQNQKQQDEKAAKRSKFSVVTWNQALLNIDSFVLSVSSDAKGQMIGVIEVVSLPMSSGTNGATVRGKKQIKFRDLQVCTTILQLLQSKMQAAAADNDASSVCSGGSGKSSGKASRSRSNSGSDKERTVSNANSSSSSRTDGSMNSEAAPALSAAVPSASSHNNTLASTIAASARECRTTTRSPLKESTKTPPKSAAKSPKRTGSGKKRVITNESTGFDETKLKKFLVMLKAGVPEIAVVHKMQNEELTDEEQAHVLQMHADKAAAARGGVSNNSSAATTAVAPKPPGNPLMAAIVARGQSSSASADNESAATTVKSMSPPKSTRKSPAANPLLAAIAAKAATFNGASQAAAATPTKASPKKASGSTSAPKALPATLRKYQVMLKAGVPEPAVAQKMKTDNIPEEEQQLLIATFKGVSAEKTSATPARKQEKTAIPEHLVKYQKMLKAGVPPPAVKSKMGADGITAADQDLVMGPGESSSSAACSSSTVAPTPKKNSTAQDIPENLQKYQKMLKAGVPMPAVGMKMKADGISSADQTLLLGSGGGAGSKTPGKTVAVNDGPKMLRMHWDPIALQDDATAEDTVWGSMQSPPPVSSHGMRTRSSLGGATPSVTASQRIKRKLEGGESQTSPQPISFSSTATPTTKARKIGSATPGKSAGYLKERDLDKLASLFSRKSAKTAAGGNAGSGKTSAAGASAGAAKSGKSLVVIDTARSTNICIGLVAFKAQSMNYSQLVDAIDAVDIEKLTKDADLCQRIKDLLPSDAEIKSFSRIKASSQSSSESDSCEAASGAGLTVDSERFLWKMSQISNLKQKVSALIFISSFASRIEAAIATLKTLNTGCDSIKQSAGLKEVMKSILAIGNAMNGGAGAASSGYNTRSSSSANTAIKAFKLSSLLKLSQTKSTDGTATVMDYLLQLLHERYNEALALAESPNGTETEGSAAVSADISHTKAHKAFHLDDDFEAIHPCCKTNISEVKEEMRVMKMEIRSMTDLLTSLKKEAASKGLDALEERVNQIREMHTDAEQALLTPTLTKCIELCAYFSETTDANGGGSQNVFDILSTFSKNFRSIKVKLLAAAARKNRAMKAAAKKANDKA